MKVLVVDNHDSFTYNLVQQLAESGAQTIVKPLEDISLKKIKEFRKLLISPGPGLPSKKLKNLIKQAAPDASVLGVCLGHQAAAMVYGGKLKQASRIYHGEAADIRITNKEYSLFRDMPDVFAAGRYHSWIIDPDTLPEILEITAVDENNEIMGLRHKEFDLHTVQFHPESILTPEGSKIISNWLRI
jgi:anthranilate synthase component II